MMRHLRDFRLGWNAPRTALVLGFMLVVTGCSGGSAPQSQQSTQETSTSTPTPSPEPSEAPGTATSVPGPTVPDDDNSSAPVEDDLADWTLQEKVGQLFMAGIDVREQGRVTYDVIEEQRVGNVFIGGRSQAGTEPVSELIDSLKSAGADLPAPMFISTDQEGGKVQVLRGTGLSDIPSAVVQSQWSDKKITSEASNWGAELSGLGINLNLAPVMDVVPNAKSAKSNAPIGYFERNYGYGANDVAEKANAFSAGMEGAGVDVALKHFPGLGRVTANTDVTAHVVDDAIDDQAVELDVFRSGIDAGAQFVLMSSAVYEKLDPDAPALFSQAIVTDLLRTELGFEGVVMTDDVGAAIQVQEWSPAQRAVKFIDAGGDMLLVAHKPQIIAEMSDALVNKAHDDAEFAQKIDDAVRRILAAKERLN